MKDLEPINKNMTEPSPSTPRIVQESIFVKSLRKAISAIIKTPTKSNIMFKNTCFRQKPLALAWFVQPSSLHSPCSAQRPPAFTWFVQSFPEHSP